LLQQVLPVGNDAVRTVFSRLTIIACGVGVQRQVVVAVARARAMVEVKAEFKAKFMAKGSSRQC